jgi:hypothetical protein
MKTLTKTCDKLVFKMQKSLSRIRIFQESRSNCSIAPLTLCAVILADYFFYFLTFLLGERMHISDILHKLKIPDRMYFSHDKLNTWVS